MLTEVQDTSGGGNTVIFEAKYDALGRRIEVANPNTGNTKRFYFDKQSIVEQTDGSDTVQQSYIWGNYIDELLLYENVSAGNEYYTLRNNNYDVTTAVDNTGAVQERYDYNPYGERFVLDVDYTGDSDSQSDINLAFGHQGLYHDTATGLVYNRARMFNPTLGRFNQRDPLGYVDGMSFYEYIRSVPMILRDPTGRSVWSWCRWAAENLSPGTGPSGMEDLRKSRILARLPNYKWKAVNTIRKNPLVNPNPWKGKYNSPPKASQCSDVRDAGRFEQSVEKTGRRQKRYTDRLPEIEDANVDQVYEKQYRVEIEVRIRRFKCTCDDDGHYSWDVTKYVSQWYSEETIIKQVKLREMSREKRHAIAESIASQCSWQEPEVY